MKTKGDLRRIQSQILLKNIHATEEVLSTYHNDLMRFRFNTLFQFYGPLANLFIRTSKEVSPPCEMEILELLEQGHPDMFLQNILDHLDRTNRLFPGSILPMVLSRLGSHPEIWVRMYHHHPDLCLALARNRKEWGYISEVFDPEIRIIKGSPGYYEALTTRMRIFPLRTSAYIRTVFENATPEQQARLIEILGWDFSPENEDLITRQIHHTRKPVRQAALSVSLRHKSTPIYGPLLEAMIQHVSSFDPKKEYSGPKDLPVTWKELAAFSNQVSKVDILTAITDPDDYLEWGKRFEGTLHRSVVVQAAIFHRSQKSLYALARKKPELVRSPSVQAALEPNSAKALLRHLSQSPGFVIDETTITLLKRAHPFLDEEDSHRIWKKFVEQWGHLPFTLEDLDLEILALRIHPNEIRSAWAHPVLQESAEMLQKLRNILKNRLQFLKKCYG